MASKENVGQQIKNIPARISVGAKSNAIYLNKNQTAKYDAEI
jgi:hypothetical protein